MLLKELGLLYKLSSRLDSGLTLTSPFSAILAAPRPGLGCGCHHVAAQGDTCDRSVLGELLSLGLSDRESLLGLLKLGELHFDGSISSNLI